MDLHLPLERYELISLLSGYIHSSVPRDQVLKRFVYETEDEEKVKISKRDEGQTKDSEKVRR
jgi:hypothetical protein